MHARWRYRCRCSQIGSCAHYISFSLIVVVRGGVRLPDRAAWRTMNDEERWAQNAAASRAHRQDPEVRAREAAARRARRQADLEAVRAREAAAKRARRQADPETVRAKDAAAKRALREADQTTEHFTV